MRLVIYILAVYTLAINIVSFVLYGVDKLKAKRELSRISEATLLWVTFFGGSVGALLGMIVFHHKTNHLKFQILVPLFFVFHLAATGVLYWYLFVYAR